MNVRHLLISLCLVSSTLNSQSSKERFLERSAPTQDARLLLANAAEAIGLSRTQGQVLHFYAGEANLQDYQSDRTYPPFFSAMFEREVWYSPASGIERNSTKMYFPGSGPNNFPASLSTAGSVFFIRDSLVAPTPTPVDVNRPLNAWAILYDWLHSSDVKVLNQTSYRDYWRNVLTRPSFYGEERLFLDVKTGFPVKLERTESHYLWGQVKVEFVYSNWHQEGDIVVPSTCFRVVDGDTKISRTLGTIELLATAQSPSLTVPNADTSVAPQMPMFLRPIPPDTVGIGKNSSLLANRGYTEAVTFANDTMYVLDATQSEERARQDEAWLAKLFPGQHPVVLVVTDLAWPHIAGVRYWIARGATVVSHRASKQFLEQVLERRWTLKPDYFEQQRSRVKFNFRAVDDSLILAGGKIRIYPIDGIGSEVALMAYIPEDRFLWAGDYIQRTDQPAAYTTEVWNATQRVGIKPERTAAQHLRLTPWKTIESLLRQK